LLSFLGEEVKHSFPPKIPLFSILNAIISILKINLNKGMIINNGLKVVAMITHNEHHNEHDNE